MATEFPVATFIEKHRADLPKAAQPGGQWDPTPAKWEEIGDGNLNFVYRVWICPSGSETDEKSSTAIVVKHAPTYIRCLGPSYLLTQFRLKVEYEALFSFHKLRPNCVPAPFLYDEEFSAVLMEDLQGYNVMRKDIVSGKVDLKSIGKVMVAIATIHQRTLKESLGGAEHEKYCEMFENSEMVSITNQYIFTKPYLSSDETNRNHPLLNEEAQSLRDNRAVCQRAEDLRKLFLEYHQCLCHGDLHTGSVMINDGVPKMFDLEFAFMGPASFDFGMFLANIIFALIRYSHLKDLLTVELLYQAMINAIKNYYQYSGSICKAKGFNEEVLGYIGCELIRRVIGAAHVEDINEIPEGELLALQLGKEFLLLQTQDSNSLMETIITVLNKKL